MDDGIVTEYERFESGAKKGDIFRIDYSYNEIIHHILIQDILPNKHYISGIGTF